MTEKKTGKSSGARRHGLLSPGGPFTAPGVLNRKPRRTAAISPPVRSKSALDLAAPRFAIYRNQLRLA